MAFPIENPITAPIIRMTRKRPIEIADQIRFAWSLVLRDFEVLELKAMIK